MGIVLAFGGVLMCVAQFVVLKFGYVVITDTEFAIRLEVEDGELDIGLKDAAAQPSCRLYVAPRLRA